MTDETVCIDLESLYEYQRAKAEGTSCDVYSDYVDCAYGIIWNEGDYYDFYGSRTGDARLCCDGEQCKVVERLKWGGQKCVNLVSVDNLDNEELEGTETVFTLTEEEFGVATGGRNER